MIAVVHHTDYVAPVMRGGGPGKNAVVRDLLLELGPAIDWRVPDPMPRAWVEAVHDPDYVAEVAEARVPSTKERRIGFPVSPHVAARAFVVPGGTYLAATLACRLGYAANSAGGSHHALADTGAGYCVFNDLAIAAVRLAGEGRRVLIVDCDVHQGDGTASLTAGRTDIATYSIHADKNFPARKARSTIDVPLADGIDDGGYMAALTTTLPPLVADFAPDLILYQAGVDPWEGDRLGRLALTREGLIVRDRWIATFARDRHLPLASTLGGGYGTDMAEVAERHVASILTLGGVFEEREGGSETARRREHGALAAPAASRTG